MTIKQEKIAAQIEEIKRQFMELGNMRPGNLNQQFRKPKEKLGEYFQLNYTFKGKTKTEHVKRGDIETIQAEIKEYQNSKDLYSRWIELSIEASKLRIKKP